MSRREQQGFILIITLGMITAFAFGASILGEWATRALRDARAAREQAAMERAMMSARSNLTFQLMTNFLSPRGLELPDSFAGGMEMRAQGAADPLGATTRGARLLRLDGRAYVYDEDLVVSVQDARGLLNLNVVQDIELSRLLTRFGVPADVHQSLINRLADFREPGDLARLGGAKRPQYLEAGRPPPPGQPLQTPWQAASVLGWDEYPQLWRNPGLPALTSAGIVVGLNVNTAPLPLLAALYDIPEDQLPRLEQARESVVLQSANDLAAYGARAPRTDPLRFISFPADTFILTFYGRRSAKRTVVSLVLTPSGMHQPWRIDYALEMPFGSADGQRIQSTVARFPAVIAGTSPR